MLSQQISWLFDPIISSSSVSLSLSLALCGRGSSNNSSRGTGEQQWSSQREPQWSRTEAKQPTSPLPSGDVYNNLPNLNACSVRLTDIPTQLLRLLLLQK